MVLALITIFGREFELVLRPKAPRRPSLPPAGPVTINTTAEAVEPAPAPGAKPARPALRLVEAA